MHVCGYIHTSGEISEVRSRAGARARASGPPPEKRDRAQSFGVYRKNERALPLPRERERFMGWIFAEMLAEGDPFGFGGGLI